jgi:DNA polymerase-3 subunit beta
MPKVDVILPRKAVLELSKLLGDTEASVRIEVRDNQVAFAFGSIEFVTKVVDGRFPDYQKVIPSGYRKQIVLDRQILQQALLRAAILSNEKFRGVRWVLTENSLRIISSNTEQEEAEEELEVEYNGEALDVGFNVSYLLDVLANVHVAQVACALGDANSSMLLTLPGNSQFQYVVMPMRI